MIPHVAYLLLTSPPAPLALTSDGFLPFPRPAPPSCFLARGSSVDAAVLRLGGIAWEATCGIAG